MFCSKCKTDKEKTEFYFDAKRRKYHVWCRLCSSTYATERRKKKKLIGGFCSGCYKPCSERQCSVCKNKNERNADPNRTRKYRAKSPEKIREQTRKLKARVLKAYGQQCKCCSETNFEFLTIDHENGGGYQHRKKVKNMYSWLIRNDFPSGFRTLCMNCNFALGRYGYCPHQTPKIVNPQGWHLPLMW